MNNSSFTTTAKQPFRSPMGLNENKSSRIETFKQFDRMIKNDPNAHRMELTKQDFNSYHR